MIMLANPCGDGLNAGVARGTILADNPALVFKDDEGEDSPPLCVETNGETDPTRNPDTGVWECKAGIDL